MKQSTALLVFVKYPEPGKVKTRLAQNIGDENAARLYRRFAEISLQRFCHVANSDCIVYFSPAEENVRFREWLGSGCDWLAQPEGDLGSRLVHGFELLLQDYARVIALGTDSPSLSLGYIERAVERLQSNDAVVGPTEDGGYYLIGLSKFLPQLFENVPWSTERVLAKTRENAERLGCSIATLPAWYDIDWLEDVDRLKSCGIPELESLAMEVRR